MRARKGAGGDGGDPWLDENQFAAAYAFAASPARWALERHDWKAAAALELSRRGSLGTGSETPKRWCITRERSARLARATRPRRAVGPKRSPPSVSALPATRDYDWSGSIGSAMGSRDGADRYWPKGRRTKGSVCCVLPPIMRMPSTSTRDSRGVAARARDAGRSAAGEWSARLRP